MAGAYLEQVVEASTLYNGVTGVKAHVQGLETVSNNLANLSTSGYKVTRSNFQDLLYQSLALAEPATEQVGNGSMTTSQNIMVQGSLQQTQSMTDLAVNGPGFFTVAAPPDSYDAGDLFYTRAGEFMLNSEGYMVNSYGYRVQGYAVSEDGTVEVGALQDIQIPLDLGASTPTNTVDLGVNLDASDFDTHQPEDMVDPYDSSTFNSSMGYSVYDAEGNMRNIAVFYQRLDSVNGVPQKVWKATVYENQDGTLVPNPPYGSNIYYMEFDSDGHLTGVTTDAVLPAGDSYTSSQEVNAISSQVSDQLGEDLSYTSEGITQVYRTTATVSFSGTTDAVQSVTIGADPAYAIAAGLTAAEAGEALADAINSQAAGAYYAQHNGAGEVTLYSEGSALDVSATGDQTTVDADTTLREVMNTINSGTAASGTMYVDVANFVNGDTVSVDGNVFTYQAVPAAANEFSTLAELTTLIDALDSVGATSDGSTINLTAADQGSDGNAIALASSNQTAALPSSTTLLGGLDGTEETVNPSHVTASTALGDTGGVVLYLARDDTGAAATLTVNGGTLGANLGLDFNTYAQISTASDGQTVENDGTIPLAFEFSYEDPDTGVITTETQVITVDYSPDDSTASSMSAGISETFFLDQDGYGEGTLTSLDIDTDGLIVAILSNEAEVPIAAVALTGFTSPGELQRWGDTLWRATEAAGEPILGVAGQSGDIASGQKAFGAIESWALELSNVDTAEEMVKMINYQRAFQANSKSITTADEMLRVAINLKA